MTEWSQAVWIAINLLLASVVIMAMVYYFNIGNSINNEISRQEANRSLMKEYRELQGFNENVVYAQDAVSAVLHYRGKIAVRVLHGTGEYAYWCTDGDLTEVLKNGLGLTNSQGEDISNWSCTGATTDYTASAVQEKFDVDRVYKGSLTYGPNGEVLGISLQKGRVDTNGNFTAD